MIVFLPHSPPHIEKVANSRFKVNNSEQFCNRQQHCVVCPSGQRSIEDQGQIFALSSRSRKLWSRSEDELQLSEATLHFNIALVTAVAERFKGTEADEYHFNLLLLHLDETTWFWTVPRSKSSTRKRNRDVNQSPACK